MLGFAHTIEKFQGLAKTDFMEIEVGDGVLKNNLISILPMEPNGKKEKGVPRVGGLMPNNAQAIGLQPILYISSEGSNEGGGGGGLQFPPEFTSHFTISKEVYNGLISTFTYWAKSITVDALKVSTSIIGMLL